MCSVSSVSVSTWKWSIKSVRSLWMWITITFKLWVSYTTTSWFLAEQMHSFQKQNWSLSLKEQTSQDERLGTEEELGSWENIGSVCVCHGMLAVFISTLCPCSSTDEVGFLALICWNHSWRIGWYLATQYSSLLLSKPWSTAVPYWHTRSSHVDGKDLSMLKQPHQEIYLLVKQLRSIFKDILCRAILIESWSLLLRLQYWIVYIQ